MLVSACKCFSVDRACANRDVNQLQCKTGQAEGRRKTLRQMLQRWDGTHTSWAPCRFAGSNDRRYSACGAPYVLDAHIVVASTRADADDVAVLLGQARRQRCTTAGQPSSSACTAGVPQRGAVQGCALSSTHTHTHGQLQLRLQLVHSIA